MTNKDVKLILFTVAYNNKVEQALDPSLLKVLNYHYLFDAFMFKTANLQA